MAVKIVTLNVNGLRSSNDPLKRRKMFKWLKINSFDIIFLQETHSDPTIEKIWQREWGGRALFSHGEIRSRGVAILFNPALQVDIKQTLLSDNGRFIIAVVVISMCEVTLVCSYGPNADNAEIYTQLLGRCNEICNSEIIWGGDFNFFMRDIDKYSSARRARNNNKCRKVVEEYMLANNLVDIWRHLHPHKKEFTFHRTNPTSKSRIDFFLVSDSFFRQIQDPKAKIVDGYLADHRAVVIELVINRSELGKSYWKFNNSLLTDENFVEEARKQINLISKENDCSSPTLHLQTVLCVFRGWAIQYAANIKKQTNATLNDLETKISAAQSTAKESDCSELTNDADGSVKLNEMMIARDEILEKMTKKNIDRNQARWRYCAERGTSYFHSLNRRYRTQTPFKCMAMVHSGDGSFSNKTVEMLRECRTFFKNLYERENRASSKVFLSNVNFKTLSSEESLELEGELTSDELKDSLLSMKGSTSPGPDGFTVPFYTTFWTELGELILAALREGFEKGFLVKGIQGSVTILIPKKNKDSRFVEGLRPISLLNVVFKILTKTLSRRVTRIIDRLICGDQTGFIKGRYIGENVRLVFDLLQYAEEKEKEGMLLFCDWEKAYDSLNWDFLKLVLQKYNFGSNFLRWINVIYPTAVSAAPEAQVQINGQLSEPYKILRGLRQGCPLSCNLFLLSIEPMLQKVRDSPAIEGLHVGNATIKVSAYADDTLFVLNGKPTCLRNTIRCLDEFHEASGLKLNKKKTQGMWIGKFRNRREGICPELDLKWEFGPVEYLGVTIDPCSRYSADLNYSKKIERLKKRINPWLSYGLTPFGKVHVLKSEALSQLVYLMSVLPKPSVRRIKELETIMFNFIWGKSDKIKRTTMKNVKTEGGLQVPDVGAQADSLKICWVKKVLDPRCKSPWKEVVHDKLFISTNLTIFHCDGDRKGVQNRLKNTFWEEVAGAWHSISHISNPNGGQILSKVLWYNRHIKINVPVNKKQMIDKGIIQIKDVYNIAKQRLLTANELQARVSAFNFLAWNGLLYAIPDEWKRTLANEKPIREEAIETFDDLNCVQKCAQWSYPLLLKAIPVSTPEKAFTKWSEELNLPLAFSWPSEFKKLYAAISDFKLRWFQLRIMHRILPTNSRLYLYGIRSSDRCDSCTDRRESIIHLFWFCPAVMHFWTQLKRIVSLGTPFTARLVILGNDLGGNRIPSKQLYAVILIAKWYIWRCRFNKTKPNIQGFLRVALDYIRVERYAAMTTHSMYKFNRNWYQLNEILKKQSTSTIVRFIRYLLLAVYQ